MKFDSKRIRLTKSLKKLFYEKKGQVYGLSIVEYIRIFKKLFEIGYEENEPFNRRNERVITDDKSSKSAQIWYEWFRIPDQDIDNNRILKIRHLKS